MLGITCDLCAYQVDRAFLMRESIHNYVTAQRLKDEAETDAEFERARQDVKREMLA